MQEVKLRLLHHPPSTTQVLLLLLLLHLHIIIQSLVIKNMSRYPA
jgi:hypothetical protein